MPLPALALSIAEWEIAKCGGPRSYTEDRLKDALRNICK